LFFTKLYSVDDKYDVLDHAMAVWLPGPHTFTGEDTVEFFLHGSRAVVDAVSKNLSKLENFENAKPGEFTKRSFFNGKLNQYEVESLHDLIFSETESQRKLALKQYENGKYMEPIRKELIDLISILEACIDFSEDVENQDLGNVKSSAENILRELKKFQRGAKRGSLIREGVRISLIGKTNVGKSSLMNRLAEKDIAIVSNISGTTRDFLETKLDLESVPVYITDTAGIRETSDVLEKEGINRSIMKAKEAQVVVTVLDATGGLWDSEFKNSEKILEEIFKEDLERILEEKEIIFCFNKVDLISDTQKNNILKNLENRGFKNKKVVFTSTVEEDGLTDFLNVLKSKVKDLCSGEGNEFLLSRQRHIILLDEAVGELEFFFESLDFDKALAAQHLRNCADCIGEISGAIVNEHVLDRIVPIALERSQEP